MFDSIVTYNYISKSIATLPEEFAIKIAQLVSNSLTLFLMNNIKIFTFVQINGVTALLANCLPV